MDEILICEICQNKDLKKVLDLGGHPLCDDLVYIGSNIVCKEYPICIVYCDNCKTAFQKFNVPKKELFSSSYHYRARMTGSVLSGMSDLVDEIEIFLGNMSNKFVIDIGCNDGSLLNFFKIKGCKTIGVEPTNAAKDSNHETIQEFFDTDLATKIVSKYGRPDIITFTNVFAHIENLPELLKAVKCLMHDKTCLAIENHYLGAVLEYGQFDTFYHEHPRTYSMESFKFIATSLGKKLSFVQFASRYGGNIRAFISHKKPTFKRVNEDNFLEKLSILNDHMKSWVFETKHKIYKLVDKYGKLRAKAFPGRAAILIKLLGLTEDHISAVYEIKGSIKVNHYVPGTRIPILPEKKLYLEKDTSLPILNLAWHLPSEVRENLKLNKYSGKIIDIKDFKRI